MLIEREYFEKERRKDHLTMVLLSIDSVKDNERFDACIP